MSKVIASTRPVVRRGLSREESALYLGISASLFDVMRDDGRVGPARMVNGRKVWDVRHLDEVFESFPFESEDDGGWKSAV